MRNTNLEWGYATSSGVSMRLLDAVFVSLEIAMRQDCALLPTERSFGEGTLALLCQHRLQAEVLIYTRLCVDCSTGPVCGVAQYMG